MVVRDMAVDLEGRTIALGAILVGLNYPTETWEEVWGHIAQDQTPTDLKSVGQLVDKLKALRPLIVDDNFVIDADQNPTFEDPAFAEEQTFEDSEPVSVETQTKPTRSKRDN
jgi:hypothetical protein